MSDLDWDRLRVFLHVARTGRLSAAAARLKLNHSTVARQMSAFEQEIGTRLFDRSPQGITLTSKGAELLVHAERIEQETNLLMACVAGHEALLSGTVRIAVPEAFGCFLVTPNLHRMQANHADISIEMIPESRTVSLGRRDADLVVSTVRPRRGRMFINKLADMSMGLYGSQAYIDRYGAPASIDELQSHRFVGYIEDLLESEDHGSLTQIVDAPHVVFRSSSIISQHSAVQAGMGLGMLHGFATGFTPGLVRILPDEINEPRTYWLTVHADLRQMPRIRAVIRFLHDLVRDPVPLRAPLSRNVRPALYAAAPGRLRL
ncbi:LysR family transcriptional regulator [uncultured Sphingomonas sp.]|uniref:LysR family transcriptional regulator n=1 Tax=uncultured Sphingomonas sp. TaxID=158754 RepID=UPI0035C9FA3E